MTPESLEDTVKQRDSFIWYLSLLFIVTDIRNPPHRHLVWLDLGYYSGEQVESSWKDGFRDGNGVLRQVH